MLLENQVKCAQGSDDAGPGGDESLENPRICFCYGVSRQEIVDALKSGKAKTLEDIQKIFQASTGCGGCQPDVEDLVRIYGLG